MTLFRTLRQVAKDTQGATIVEFGFVALPMCILLVGGLDLAHQSYVRTVMQGALNDSARRAAVERPDLAGDGDTLEEQIEDSIRQVVGPIAADAVIDVDQKSYFDFSNIGNPEKLMTDVNGNGEFDEADGDCWEDMNENGEFDVDGGSEGKGGASDVVFYRASITMPRLFSGSMFGADYGTMRMELQTAVRNQPYGTQSAAPVICAETA